MEILMITGSPHKDGTSNVLACEFIRGAEEAGHNVYRFDSAFEDVSPCRGCDSCRVHGGNVFILIQWIRFMKKSFLQT
jgi:multimeric flavodoxin WrbA